MEQALRASVEVLMNPPDKKMKKPTSTLPAVEESVSSKRLPDEIIDAISADEPEAKKSKKGLCLTKSYTLVI